MCFFRGYYFFCVIYVGFAGFELQYNTLVKLGKQDIFLYHLKLIEWRSRLLGGFQSYFADVNGIFLCYFKSCMNVQLVKTYP